MADWESDPGLAEIRSEFIDSFPLRLEQLRAFLKKWNSGAVNSAEILSLQVLVHKLAGSAGSYGFRVLSRISCCLDDSLSVGIANDSLERESQREKIKTFFELLEDALSQAIKRRNDPEELMGDARMKDLISFSEFLNDSANS